MTKNCGTQAPGFSRGSVTIEQYRQTVVAMLRGETPDLLPYRERLDWQGVGAVLQLFDETSGRNRTAIIRAFGKIAADESSDPAVRAQVIDLASDLDLAELDPIIRPLADRADLPDLVRQVAANFVAYRTPLVMASVRADRGRAAAALARQEGGH